jgi:hypothetical protein
MPSAAGIIIATGAMTLINQPLSQNQPLSTVADKINWKIIPATAIAAGIFYGLEQVAPTFAKGLAALAFFTAFVAPHAGLTIIDPQSRNANVVVDSPLTTLLVLSGIKVS